MGAAGDISDMYAGVMTGLEELRRDMTKRIDQVDERAHQGRENLQDELTHVMSQARVDQAQLIRNTDQRLAESLAQANRESEEREARMTREIEPLLNLMMRKLDEILNGSNRKERSNPRERSRQANNGDGAGSYAGAQLNSRANYESRNRERPRAAPSSPGWTNPVPPETDATPETRLPTVPQVRSVPDLTTVSKDTTMYASMFEPLNRSLETIITKLSRSTERETGQEGH